MSQGDQHQAPGSVTLRWWTIAALVAAAVALVASSAEIFHNTAAQVDHAQSWRDRRLPGAVPEGLAAPGADQVAAAAAVSYREIGKTRRGLNAGWQSRLDDLVYTPPTPEVLEGRSALTVGALARRNEHRAYAGAPPTIPHPIDQQDVSACLACHQDGLILDGRVAAPIPHPAYQSCTQCHAPEQNPDVPPSTLEVPSGFVAARAPGHGGSRAWSGAPPTIPHTTTMRGECASCHGPLGEPGIRSTHPERQSCTQCHAPSATLDQRPLAGGPGG